MGKVETASAFIGMKILLSDLVLQINESNFNLIKKMIYDGCIEDSNNHYNDDYRNIIGYDDNDNRLPDTYLECKEYLINAFQYSNCKLEADLINECLFEQHLLVPIKDILETERWGYNRDGANSASRSLDFDLSVDIKIYEDIKNFSIIFFIKQHSG
jgi:hypothetical protein